MSHKLMLTSLERYADLLGSALFIIVLSVFIPYLFLLQDNHIQVLVAIVAAILSYLLMRIGKRETTTAVFKSDIYGLLEILKELDILGEYEELYTTLILPKGWQAFVDHHENYFAVFENNSRDMGFLRAKTAEDITSFYLYLKAARDVRRRLVQSRDAETEKRKQNIIYIVIMLDKCIQHGTSALRRLGYDSEKLADLDEMQQRASNLLSIASSSDNEDNGRDSLLDRRAE